MKYPNGRKAKLGDQVKLSNGDTGVIVFSIDTDEFSEGFNKEEWSYLEKGVMVRTDSGALVHYEDPNDNLIFFNGSVSILES